MANHNSFIPFDPGSHFISCDWGTTSFRLRLVETHTLRVLAEVKDDLSRYLRLAVDEEIVITRHGRPAGILIGFATEDDWFDYRLEHHPEFLRRIADARAAIREGRGTPLREI